MREKHADIRCPGVIDIVSIDKEIFGEETKRVPEHREDPDEPRRASE